MFVFKVVQNNHSAIMAKQHNLVRYNKFKTATPIYKLSPLMAFRRFKKALYFMRKGFGDSIYLCWATRYKGARTVQDRIPSVYVSDNFERFELYWNGTSNKYLAKDCWKKYESTVFCKSITPLLLIKRR